MQILLLILYQLFLLCHIDLNNLRKFFEMKILSFDTSNSFASVAIIDDSRILSYNITKQASQQAEKLFCLISKSLKDANVMFDDIDLLMVTNGPGSFTGVRVGLSAALGIKIASNKIVKSISNFQVLAWKARELFPNKKNIAVILDARREQFYFQIFDMNLNPINESSLMMIDEVFKYLSEEVVFVGDGIKFLPQEYFNESLNIVTNAEILSHASEFYWTNGGYNDLIPLYIRQPDALEIKK